MSEADINQEFINYLAKKHTAKNNMDDDTMIKLVGKVDEIRRRCVFYEDITKRYERLEEKNERLEKKLEDMEKKLEEKAKEVEKKMEEVTELKVENAILIQNLKHLQVQQQQYLNRQYGNTVIEQKNMQTAQQAVDTKYQFINSNDENNMFVTYQPSQPQPKRIRQSRN